MKGWTRNTNPASYQANGQNLPANDPRYQRWLTKRRLVKALRAGGDPEQIVTLTTTFQKLKTAVQKLCACGCGTRVNKPGSMTQCCRLRARHAAAATLCFLLFAFCFAVSGCRSSHYSAPVILPSPPPPPPPRAVVPTRTWTASWNPWTCPVPARIKIYWSSNAVGPWSISGDFASTNLTGQITTPLAANNFFRTGYSITK